MLTRIEFNVHYGFCCLALTRHQYYASEKLVKPNITLFNLEKLHVLTADLYLKDWVQDCDGAEVRGAIRDGVHHRLQQGVQHGVRHQVRGQVRHGGGVGLCHDRGGEMWVQVWNDLRQQVRHRLRTKGKEWPHISHLTSHNDYYYCCQAFSFSKFPIFCLLICFISNFKSSRPETGLTFLFFTELYKRSAYYTLNGLSVCLRTQLTQIIMLLWS